MFASYQSSGETLKKSSILASRSASVNLGLPRPLGYYYSSCAGSYKFSAAGLSASSSFLVHNSTLPRGHSILYSKLPVYYRIFTFIQPSSPCYVLHTVLIFFKPFHLYPAMLATNVGYQYIYIYIYILVTFASYAESVNLR